MLGGAATHFALAASLYDRVSVVGSRGRGLRRGRAGGAADARDRHARRRADRGRADVLLARRVRLGPQRAPHARHAAERVRRLRAEAVAVRRAPATPVFLANIQPQLQREVLDQCPDAAFVALDSMDLWIETERDALLDVIGDVDCVILNDAELRQLTGTPSVVGGGPRRSSTLGPDVVVAKQGEYGAVLVTADDVLRPARVSARARRRPHRRRRHVRGRLRRLPRAPARSIRRGAAPRDRARHRARVVQRRGVRHRADARRDASRTSRARVHDLQRFTRFDPDVMEIA